MVCGRPSSCRVKSSLVRSRTIFPCLSRTVTGSVTTFTCTDNVVVGASCPPATAKPEAKAANITQPAQRTPLQPISRLKKNWSSTYRRENRAIDREGRAQAPRSVVNQLFRAYALDVLRLTHRPSPHSVKGSPKVPKTHDCKLITREVKGFMN